MRAQAVVDAYNLLNFGHPEPRWPPPTNVLIAEGRVFLTEMQRDPARLVSDNAEVDAGNDRSSASVTASRAEPQGVHWNEPAGQSVPTRSSTTSRRSSKWLARKSLASVGSVSFIVRNGHDACARRVVAGMVLCTDRHDIVTAVAVVAST